jgi:hypothetical protein
MPVSGDLEHELLRGGALGFLIAFAASGQTWCEGDGSGHDRERKKRIRRRSRRLGYADVWPGWQRADRLTRRLVQLGTEPVPAERSGAPDASLGRLSTLATQHRSSSPPIIGRAGVKVRAD